MTTQPSITISTDNLVDCTIGSCHGNVEVPKAKGIRRIGEIIENMWRTLTVPKDHKVWRWHAYNFCVALSLSFFNWKLFFKTANHTKRKEFDSGQRLSFLWTLLTSEMLQPLRKLSCSARNGLRNILSPLCQLYLLLPYLTIPLATASSYEFKLSGRSLMGEWRYGSTHS
jgi:hypothetical protein